MNFIHTFSSAIIMILLISLLIIVHEAGHFIAAKLVGIRVDKFGFGLPIGPVLFRRKIGETELLIHAFLLGGYVSFPDDEEDCDLPMDSPLRYCNKSAGQKSLVISAGVIFNVITAYVLIFLTGLIWHHLPANSYTVKFVQFAPSAVESVKKSGIEPGDILYSVNGTKIDFPLALNKYLNISKEFDGFTQKARVDGIVNELKILNPDLAESSTIQSGKKVFLPDFTDENPVKLSRDNIIGLEKYKSDEIELNSVQKKLRDEINYSKEYTTSFETTLEDIAFALSDTKKPVSITVLRDNKQIELNPVYSGKDGLIGIEQSMSANYVKTDNLFALVKHTCQYVNYNMGFMFYTLGKLFTGKIPMSEMNGIIAITKVGTEIIANQGLFHGILLTSIISLNLALINILPIPALDGGHLLFIIIEKFTGRKVSRQFVEKLSSFFFYLLIALMVLIIYNDINAWITGKI